MSSPKDFNDVYDCHLNMKIIDSNNYIDDVNDYLNFNMNREQRRHLKKNKLDKDAKKLEYETSNIWNKIRSQIRICCFTESWDSLLM